MHCGCCKFTTALTIYGIFLWILGILVFADICTQFANKYFPLWYPLVGLFIFFIFLGGLVLIATWFCKDTAATRTSLKLGGWLILGSTIVLIFWAIIYVWAKESAENPSSDDSSDQQKVKVKIGDIKLGTGDDDDDYHDQSNAMYILGYLLWGAVIITFTVLLIYAAFQYDDVAPKDEEDMEADKKSEKSKKSKGKK
jgi:uncharacterized membrane protein